MTVARTNGSSSRSISSPDRAAAPGCRPRPASRRSGRRSSGTVGDGRDQVQVVLAAEPLDDDLHVQRPEKAGPEPEAERERGLRLVDQGGVVQLELAERLLELQVVVACRPGRARSRPSASSACSRAAASTIDAGARRPCRRPWRRPRS